MKKTTDTLANAITITLSLILGIAIATLAFGGMLYYQLIIAATEACSFLLRAL